MSKGSTIRVWSSAELPADWYKRASASDEKETADLEGRVRDIIRRVREEGDSALFDFAQKFDGVALNVDNVQVTPEEIKAAYAAVKPQQVAALKLIKNRLEVREQQVVQRETTPQLITAKEDIIAQTVYRPLESVGCYVPGGLAVYPSSLIMTATPAKVAGVKRIVVCSPTKADRPIDPLVLVAADICGVNEVYKVGGAQAIAALAYGTQTIKPVKKIVGPGNKYVMVAKTIVSQNVAIDMPAGPSEVLVLADETANPRVVAADMISQAEHTPDSTSGLITTSPELAKGVVDCLEATTATLERNEIVKKSLETYGFIITCNSTQEMIALANQFASEHLEIITSKPQEMANQINNAGLILLGPYTPVALSDYASGTNHVLPTGGFAKSFSGLSSIDFLRRVNIVKCSQTGLEQVKGAIKVLTDTEKLPNHYKAVAARFEK